MAKASLIGLITQGPELQHSAKGEPYVRFSVAEYVGFGPQRHTQFIDVWAWGYMAQRLAKCSLGNGDFIFFERHVGVGRIHEKKTASQRINA
ncbi:MAG: single-stranded DNA-binding protein [Oscillospiraceae bacterium]